MRSMLAGPLGYWICGSVGAYLVACFLMWKRFQHLTLSDDPFAPLHWAMSLHGLPAVAAWLVALGQVAVLMAVLQSFRSRDLSALGGGSGPSV